MPKRIIDGEGIWRSSKLASITESSMRLHYAWLLPLAMANGVFELNPELIWSLAYAYTHPEIDRDDVREILDEMVRRRLLFPFEDGGKLWGYWVGIEKPGRLPAPARRGTNERCGPEPPQYELQRFIDGHQETPGLPWTPASGLVYFIQGKRTKLIKIGWAIYPRRRLETLQVGSPDALTLLGFCPGERTLEGALHRRFATDRVHGEWFRPSKGILEFIVSDSTLESIEWTPYGLRTESVPRPKPKPDPNPTPTPTPNGEVLELPDWLPQQEWFDFVAMRLNIRRPIKTAKQAEYCIRELAKLRDAGNDPAEVLARSIAGNWQGLFPLTQGTKNAKPTVAEQTRRNAAIALERLEKRERERTCAAGADGSGRDDAEGK